MMTIERNKIFRPKKNLKNVVRFVTLLFGLLGIEPASAEIHQWKDQDGQTHFSNIHPLYLRGDTEKIVDLKSSPPVQDKPRLAARAGEKTKPVKTDAAFASNHIAETAITTLKNTIFARGLIWFFVLLVAVKILAELWKYSAKKKLIQDALSPFVEREFSFKPSTRKNSSKDERSFFWKWDSSSDARSIYYQAKPVLSEIERKLFRRLHDALSQDYIVIAQTQMSRFLNIDKARTAGKKWQSADNKITKKSIDFLVCDKDFRVVAAIELQDRTHLRPDRQESDEFKRHALSTADVRFIEYHASALPSVEEIREHFSNMEEIRGSFSPEPTTFQAYRPAFDYSDI